MTVTRLIASIVAGWLLSGVASAAESPVAATAPDLVAALERAPLVVVAEVREVERGPGPHAHVATVSVETSVVGTSAPALRVVWDELAPSRRPRLAAGERALIGLERVVHPDASRFRLASEGRAWWAAPDAASVNVLRHHLALAPEERAGPTGVRHLLTLAALAPAPLARSAEHRLAGPGVAGGTDLPPEVAALAVRALGRADRRSAGDGAGDLVAWVEANPSEALEQALEAALAAGDAAPAVHAARAVLPGGLRPEAWAALAASPEAPLREVVARHAPASEASALAVLAGSAEPSHRVREAAVGRLATVAFDPVVVVAALGDGHPAVRLAAANALAARGDSEVPTLRRVAFEGTPREQQTAITGLRIWGSAAAAAVLQEIVETHPSEGMRLMAGVALGEPLGEVHAEHR